MFQFNVSFGGNNTMVGGSGEPAQPRNHGGGMLITHLLHIITRHYTEELPITHLTIRCP